MGACASVPKSRRAEATDVPAPEPPKEDSPATSVVEVPTVPVEAKEEEAAEKKAESGDDAKQGEKVIEVDAPKEAAEVESEKPKTEAPAPLEPEADAEEEKKTEVAEQK